MATGEITTVDESSSDLDDSAHRTRAAEQEEDLQDSVPAFGLNYDPVLALRRAEYSRMSDLVRDIDSGVALVTRSGDVALANTAMCQILGREPESQEQFLSLLLPHEENTARTESEERIGHFALHCRVDRVFSHGETIRVLDLKIRDQSFDLVLSPVRDGEWVYGVAFSMHNITKRKEIEQQLEKARQIAEEASDAKTLFLAQMSHELRTPLATIIGVVGQLRKEPASEAQKRLLQPLAAAAEAQLILVDNIIDLGRIEADRLEAHNHIFEPNQLILRVLDIVRPRLHPGVELSLDYHTEVPRQLLGDGGRLQQILLNLLSNAAKFTPHGSVVLELAHRERTAALIDLEIRVVDTGIGIPEDRQSEIFEKYIQVENRLSRSVGGSGLGLAICRRLTEFLGGKIEVKSVDGRGSSFSVTLPFAVSVQEHPAQTDSLLDQAERPSPRGRILVTEDEPGIALVVEAILLAAGHEVDLADNGVAAVDLFCERPYDLVLMDVQLPVLDGYEATRRIRAWEKKKHRRPVHILALSAHAFTEHAQASLAAGCDVHLVKPIAEETLLFHVSKALKDWHAEE